MTKRPASQFTPLADDPAQPEFLRELVRAGRDADARTDDLGYDFEAGFEKHMALIASGAPMPPWAEGMKAAPSSASTGVGTGAAGAGGAAAGTSLVGWLAGAAVGVAVVSATWWLTQSGAPAPKPGRDTSAPVVTSPAPSAAPAPSRTAAAPQAAASPLDAPAPSNGSVSSSKGERAGVRGARADRRASTMASNKVRVTETQAEGAVTPALQPAKPGDAFAGARRTGAQPAAQDDRAASTASSASASAANAVREDVVAPQPRAAAEQPHDDGKLEREMAMLSMAQRVLDTDPKRALSLARQGEAEFAGSMFTQERQQLLLLALVKLGELDEARRLAKPFLQRYPTGPFSERVRHALATGQVQH
jgi:hypothetical protein